MAKKYKKTKGRKEKKLSASATGGWLARMMVGGQKGEEDIFFSLYFSELIDYIEHASFYHFMQIQNDLSKQTKEAGKKMFQDVNSR